MFWPRIRAYVSQHMVHAHTDGLTVGDGDRLSDSNCYQMGAQVHHSHCVSLILLEDGHLSWNWRRRMIDVSLCAEDDRLTGSTEPRPKRSGTGRLPQ